MNYPRITPAMINAKGFDGENPFIPAALQAVKNLQDASTNIRGTMFYVDPTSGLNTNTGLTPEEAFKDLQTAYAACTDGAGDGIIIFSAGTTASATTSYLSHPLNWTKSGITVIGVASGCGLESRARISNVVHTTGSISVLAFVAGANGVYDKITRTTGSFITNGFAVGDVLRINTTGNGADATGLVVTGVEALTLTLATIGTLVTETAVNAGASVVSSYCASLLNVSGNNNIFYNIHAFNSDTDALALGCLVLTGSRNEFILCHFVGGSCTTQTANERSVEFGVGASANVFLGGTIGTDTIDRGNNANCELYFSATDRSIMRNECKGVKFLAWANGGTAHVAIKSASATSLGRHMEFEDCKFMCYVSDLGADQASVFGGTGFNTAKLFFTGKSTMLGYALWDAAAGNDCCFTTAPQGVAAGGKGIVAS